MKSKFKPTTTANYYDIKDDLLSYRDAWCYLVWSKRGSGKTYSALRFMVENDRRFMFMKRTIEDVKMLCAGGSRKGITFDVSPFVPLNRDFGWNIKPVPIVKGIAGFYLCNSSGDPFGSPIGYCCALSASKDIKGFDMSDCDYIIFDEFIPRKHERINRGEGEQLLDIYMTIRRDRMSRGRNELKLICLANAMQVNNPVFQTLDVIDDAVQMDVINEEFVYLEQKKILLHKVPERYNQEETQSGIELAMSGTEWAEMAFSGNFAYDDFTAVKHNRMKGYRPLCSYEYKRKTVYIYEKDGYYYATKAKAKVSKHYNLSRENEQKKFYIDFVSDLREEVINDRFTFQEFTMYDLIVNYKKIFDL